MLALTHLVPILDTGEVYTWGREEGDGRLGLGPGRGPNEGGGLSIPCKVKALPVPMATASCGGFFTMVLTEEGQIWNWGGKNDAFVCRTFSFFSVLLLGYKYLFYFSKCSEGALMK